MQQQPKTIKFPFLCATLDEILVVYVDNKKLSSNISINQLYGYIFKVVTAEAAFTFSTRCGEYNIRSSEYRFTEAKSGTNLEVCVKNSY